MPSLRQWLKHPGTYLLALGGAGSLLLADSLRAPGSSWCVRGYDSTVSGYQRHLRPRLAGRVHCRLHPSCSEYSRQAVRKHGLWRGLLMTAQRLGACQASARLGPWNEPTTKRPAEEPDRSNDRGELHAMSAGHSIQLSAQAFGLAAAGLRESAIATSDRALQFARTAGHPRGYRVNLIARSFLLDYVERPAAAAEAAQAAIDSARADGDSLLVAGGAMILALVELKEGSYGRSVAALEQARTAAQQNQAGGWDALNAGFLELGATAALIPIYEILLESPTASNSAAGDLTQLCSTSAVPFCAELRASLRWMSRQTASWLETSNTRARPWPIYHAYLAKAPTTNHAQRSPRDLDRVIEEPVCMWRGVPLAPRAAVKHRSASATWQTVSNFLLVTGQWSRARELLDRSALAALQAGEAEYAAFALRGITNVHWITGEFDLALEAAAVAANCYQQSTLTTSNRDLFAAQSGGVKTSFFLGDLFDMLWLERRFSAAFYVAERSRSLALLRSTSRPLNRAQDVPRNSFSQELARLSERIASQERNLALALSVDRQREEHELVSLRAEFEGLLARSAGLSPEFSAVTTPQAVTVHELQSQLDPDVSLVSYFATDTDLHAWVVEREAFHAFQLEPLGSDDSAFPCFAHLIRRGRSAERVAGGCADEKTLATGLYEQLVAPLRPAIHHSRWIVIPHGNLHFVPFGALLDPRSGRYLVEDVTLTYAPSASVLHFLNLKESRFLGRALVLGDPLHFDPRLARLPGAQQEALAVAALFGTLPRLGPAATENALNALDPAPDVVHLAAHGVYYPNSPRFSRIALAPGEGFDGNLEVHEIFSRLDLTGVNLVVLSACETALGEHTGGDEIVSLHRALLYAGTSGVISTLWKVDDQVSTELMISFYQHLRAGDTAAEALRHAQLLTLRRPGRQNPYFWAGFVLTGDPRARWEQGHTSSREVPHEDPSKRALAGRSRVGDRVFQPRDGAPRLPIPQSGGA